MTDVKVTKVPAVDERSLPVFAEVEQLTQAIRTRAYEIFAGRTLGLAGALDDWLAAERAFGLPAAELRESDAAFSLAIAVPGFEAGEVVVTATPRELIVKAQHRTERKEETMPRTGETRWSEIGLEHAYRRIEFPEAIVVDKITATMRNGLLVVVAPKARLLSAEATPIPHAA